MVSAINCYFMSQGGAMFRAQVECSPYLFLQIKVSRCMIASSLILQVLTHERHCPRPGAGIDDNSNPRQDLRRTCCQRSRSNVRMGVMGRGAAVVGAE